MINILVDHILLYRGDVEVKPNVNEVSAIHFLKRDELQSFIDNPKHIISPWFRLIAETMLPKWWDDLEALEIEPDQNEIGEKIQRFY